jgi:hypothetical protein
MARYPLAFGVSLALLYQAPGVIHPIVNAPAGIHKACEYQRLDERRRVTLPAGTIGYVSIIHGGHIAGLGIIQAPPPEGVQMADSSNLRHAQGARQPPGLTVCEQRLMALNPGHS